MAFFKERKTLDNELYQEEIESKNLNEGKQTSILSFLRELVILVVIAYVLALLIKTFIVQPFKIEQQSMLPTLYPGDRVFASKFAYFFSEPKRGDIVTLKDPADESRVLIKRIVATEGETISIKDGKVYINERLLKESYVVYKDVNADYGPVRVPEGCVFVMGDNRPQSRDSRFFGYISERDLIGKVFLVYWPVSKISFISSPY